MWWLKLTGERSKRAFTLLELILGLIISMSIFWVLNSLWNSQLKNYKEAVEDIKLGQQLVSLECHFDKLLFNSMNVVYPVIANLASSSLEVTWKDPLTAVQKNVRWELSSNKLLFWPDYGSSPGNYEVLSSHVVSLDSNFCWYSVSGKKWIKIKLALKSSDSNKEQVGIYCFLIGY